MTENFSIDSYHQQLNSKVTHLKDLFSDCKLPEIKVYSSPISHYRVRAEFCIWHNKVDMYHVMHDKETKKRIRIENFPIASQLINAAMQAIIPLLQPHPLLRDRLFQIDYMSTLSGQLLISLLYHKKLGDEWVAMAKILRQQLIDQGLNINILGRATKQKICLDTDYVDEKLPIGGREFIYRQVENSFTQPNAAINISMLEWATSISKNISGDLLEFYCGNGNFSIALAHNFRKVLATEIAKVSVQSALHNKKINKIDNLEIIRLSAEEFTQALKGERKFKRLQGIDLSDYDCHTVLVDPPRGGLDSNTIDILRQYQNIIYISCNPTTLKANLTELANTHCISEFAIFDQFPYTQHIECGVLLSKL